MIVITSPMSEHEDDDRDRGRPHLREVGPRHLAHLGHDVVVERDAAADEPDCRVIPGVRQVGHVTWFPCAAECLLQRGQYFFHSTRSGWRRLFFVVK